MRREGSGETAAAVTGDAHGLDDGRTLSALVLRSLALRNGGLVPGTPEERRRSWEAAGVVPDEVSVALNDNTVTVEPRDQSKTARSRWGLSHAMVASLADGVSKGFEKRLSLVGVGFRAQAQGTKLNLQVGYSHPVVMEMPAGVKVECPTQTEINIKGADRQVVGQIAAEVRAVRPPEPYKGKGIRYVGERVVLKETKKK